MKHIATRRPLDVVFGSDPDWFVTQRWYQYQAEWRINTLRICCIAVFYTIHLLTYASSHGNLPEFSILQLGAAGQISPRLHFLVTILVGAWLMAALGITICLVRQVFPAWLGALATIVDTVMVTAVIYLAAGPRSPLIVANFLIIASSALRLDLSGVRLATGTTVLGYVVLLGVAKWPATFWKDEPTSVPRYSQLIFIAALVLTGTVLGQLIRLLPHMARYYAERKGHPTSHDERTT